MIKIYQSFEELASAMCKGEGLLHLRNCALHRYGEGGDACLLWQSGVMSFAEWLDHLGVVVKIPDTAENFYEFAAKRMEIKNGPSFGET